MDARNFPRVKLNERATGSSQVVDILVKPF